MGRAAYRTTTEKGRGWAFERHAGPIRRAAIGQPCPRCGVTMGTGKRNPAGATVDHIIPLMMGGTNDPANMRAMCRRCNCVLGNQALRVVRVRQGRRAAYSVARFGQLPASRRW